MAKPAFVKATAGEGGNVDKKIGIIVVVVLLLLGVTGVMVFKSLTAPPPKSVALDEEVVREALPEVDSSVIVVAKRSKAKDNTVVLSASGLASGYTSIAYELTYNSEGLVKGVNSGSKPIDVTDKVEFEREVYMGTCSRNVCKPDLGVKSVSVVLEFTARDGKKSQFSGEFDL